MSDKPRIPRQGEIWDAYLDPTVGREQGGRRPVLVISPDRFNSAASELCMVLPLTTRDRGIRVHLPVMPPEGGLKQPSFILCDQLRTVSHERLKRFRGAISTESIAATLHVVHILLGSDTISRGDPA
jgi:mRNA interferase MazF